MKYEIIRDFYNPFLKRRELELLVTHENAPTPNKAALQKFVADSFNVEIKRVEICKIFSERGIGRSKVKVKIWDEPKVKNLWEKIKSKEGKEESSKEQKNEQSS